MSYRRSRVYKCEICGKREIGVKCGDFWFMPDGWHGTNSRNGQCLCGKCSATFAKLRGMTDEVTE